MAVWVRAPLGDLAIRNVQRCVQVDDAVTLVVVRVASGASFAKRQRKLRRLESARTAFARKRCCGAVVRLVAMAQLFIRCVVANRVPRRNGRRRSPR